MSELIIKAGGKYRTRDGHEARVYATDGGRDGFPLQGAVLNNSGNWMPSSWTNTGSHYFHEREYPLDLVSEIETTEDADTEKHRIDAERYEYIRTLNPQQYAELWQSNLDGDSTFDDLVDEGRSKK